MDARFATLDAAVTQEERKAALVPVQQFFWEDLPNIKANELHTINAFRSDIKGYQGWYRPRFVGVWRAQ